MHEIVVVGASLGGMQALQIVLARLPATFSLPVVIAQHRTKDGEGGLASHLARASKLPVQEPVDKQLIVPGTVYLAPADYHLLLDRDMFLLSTDAPVSHARPSIDVLFESAADAFGGGTVGVILTGTRNDGARGLLRIKQRGGFILAQDPATAESPAMPRAALEAAACPVLPLEDIGSLLGTLAAS